MPALDGENNARIIQETERCTFRNSVTDSQSHWFSWKMYGILYWKSILKKKNINMNLFLTVLFWTFLLLTTSRVLWRTGGQWWALVHLAFYASLFNSGQDFFILKSINSVDLRNLLFFWSRFKSDNRFLLLAYRV